MKNDVKIKPGFKRFLLNYLVRFVTWALLLVPILFMFFKSEHGDNFYKYAIPIAMFVTLGILLPRNNKRGVRRYKYRYILLLLLYSLYTIIYSLLDYYFYGVDYVSLMIIYDCFYALICSPVIIARTYYSRGLDLLDFMYDGYEENAVKYIIGIVAGFYIVTFGLLFVLSWLGLNKAFFSSHIIDGYEFIVFPTIELIFFLIGYSLYVLYKKKHDDYIYYRPI